ncbi:MAG: hypothetical protein HQL64_05805 [Magnetococcales bacterium]|nr:hypothetical protein [Magnetococcales bacterium]
MAEWTPKKVAARLDEAAGVMKRLPSVRPRKVQSAWPPIIREFYEAYGWSNVEVRLGPPSAEAISRMDECMEWLRWLDRERMQLVWARAEHLPWKTILERIGVGRTKGWHLWMSALQEIATRLDLEGRCSNSMFEQ